MPRPGLGSFRSPSLIQISRQPAHLLLSVLTTLSLLREPTIWAEVMSGLDGLLGSNLSPAMGMGTVTGLARGL